MLYAGGQKSIFVRSPYRQITTRSTDRIGVIVFLRFWRYRVDYVEVCVPSLSG